MLCFLMKAFPEHSDQDVGWNVGPGSRGLISRAHQWAAVRAWTVCHTVSDSRWLWCQGLYESRMLSDLPAEGLERQHGRRHTWMEGKRLNLACYAQRFNAALSETARWGTAPELSETLTQYRPTTFIVFKFLTSNISHLPSQALQSTSTV